MTSGCQGGILGAFFSRFFFLFLFPPVFFFSYRRLFLSISCRCPWLKRVSVCRCFSRFFSTLFFSLCDADYFVPHLWRNLRRQHCIHALIQPRQRRALQQIRVTCLAGEASKPASKGGAAGEFSSPGSTFCADSYFGIRPTPVLPQ